MGQFFIYIINALGVAIFDLVDSAFGNNLGLDSICVLSAFTIITWCANVMGNLGTYAYEVKMKYFSECVILQAISSGIVSVILLLTHNILPHVYHLTEKQYSLFSKCLIWFAIPFVIRRIASLMGTYVELACKNKILIVSNIVYYMVMIASDAVVVLSGGKCYHLVITTGLSWTIYFLFLLIFGQIKLNKPSKQGLKECMSAAKDRLIDRALGKIATVVFNIFASYLGTELYALHSIGYAIATNSETVTDVWYSYQILRLHNIEDVKEKYKKYKENRRKTFIPTVLICYGLLALLILPMHGETNLLQAFLISCLYETQAICLAIYENARGFLTSIQNTKILRYGGLIGILVRIPVVLISYYTPIGLYGFALASGIDFLMRGIFYSYEAKKYVIQHS